MRLKTIKKWSLRALGLIVGLAVMAALAFFVMFNGVVDSIYGGKTEIANHQQFQIDARPTAITNVSVLSPDGTEMLADRTVVLKDGKIVSVVQNGDVPNGMSEIDGQGKYLIPGLVDSHMHLQRSPNDLLLYVANGVTEVRDMSGTKDYLKIRQQIENGRVGPTFFAASPQMITTSGLLQTGYENLIKNVRTTKDAKQAAKAARKLVEEGYDGLKLYGNLDMDSYRKVLDVAEELDIPTIGHMPNGMPLSELRTTKLQQIGHIEEFVKALLREFGDFDEQGGGEAFLQFVESRKQEIAGDLAANDIAVHSTLWFMESIETQVLELETLLPQVHLEFANPGIVEGSPQAGVGWLPDLNQFKAYAGETPEERLSDAEFWNARINAHYILLKEMVENDVTILAATDASAALTVAGFSLQDELQSLSRAGMSPAQALYSATAAPAKVIGSNAGVIEAGRRADLVLLNENPLTDIENTTSINTVILKGRVHDRAQLDEMLEAVKAANASSRNFDLSVYQ